MTWALNLIKHSKVSLIVAALCVGLGFAVAWHWQGLRLDAARAEHAAYVAQAEAHAAIAEKVKIETEARWKQEVQNAQDESDKRLSALKNDADASRAAALWLRDTVSALQSRLAESACPAVAQSAIASAKLLEECSGEYRELAAVADGHASDIKTLIQAWPK
jgi:hypothetical protein